MGVETIANGKRVDHWAAPLSPAQLAQVERDRVARESARVAPLAAQLFAASIDHAPHAHAFEYSEDAVLQATASARKYAVAQARALLQEVDAQLMEDTNR